MPASVQKEIIKISSVEKGVNLDVWLHTPAGEEPFPVVVAAHGMTVIKSAGMAVFAERWARDAGYASLVFDYRGFGASDGLPRDVLSLEKQLQDFQSVVAWARGRPAQFRTDKIVLMGSAMSALQVSELLLRDPQIAGGMVHSPLLDGYAALMASEPKPRLMFWAAVDYLCGKLGLPPVYVRAIGKPTEFAFLNTPSCYPGFEAMFANSPTSFREAPNVVAPRLVFELMGWRPGTKLAHIRAPMLVVAPDSDDTTPFRLTKEAVDGSAGKVEFVTFPGGHFDVMEGGKGFDVNIAAQIKFLKDALQR